MHKGNKHEDKIASAKAALAAEKKEWKKST